MDRVAAGILAALTTPEAIGARVHLATDNRIRSEEVCRITEEELEVSVRMADPTLTRNLTLPLVKALLLALGEPKLANVLERLGTIFGVYGEWGQPIHDVGNDVRLLGLPIRRPDTLASFRMLCRHNKYVQEFGQVRDLDEIARRERLWENVIDEIEYETRPAGGVDAAAGVPAAARGEARPADFHLSDAPSRGPLRRPREGPRKPRGRPFPWSTSPPLASRCPAPPRGVCSAEAGVARRKGAQP